MEQHNKHIIYSAADIRRYLDGSMAPAEMHALEKAALDDLFLAEAIEGYESISANTWQPQLDALHKAFAQPVASTPAKVVPIGKSRNNWFKYAAAIFITGGLAASFFLLNRNNKTAETNKETAIAKTENQAPVPQNAVTPQGEQGSKPSQSPPVASADSQRLIGAAANGIQAVILPQQDNLHIRMDSAFAFTPKVIESNPLAKYWAKDDMAKESEKEFQEVFGYNKKSAEPSVPATTNSNVIVNANNGNGLNNAPNGLDLDRNMRSQDYNYSNRERKNLYDISNFYNQDNSMQRGAKQQVARPGAPEMNNRFVGVVVGSDNTPLPFANINVTNEGFGTYTDANGLVRLVSADSIINIEVKSLGYRSRSLTLNAGGTNSPNKIVLEEEPMALAETSVAGNRQVAKLKKNTVVSRRAILLASDSAQNAEPEDGWDKYRTYLTNNYNLPEEVTNKNVHGEVQVSFDVDRNGRISNIAVDKSLCADCDELAKRLVEQGPQWKVKKGQKAKARVKIQF